ncbi:unnamed protein product [Moneuplotes crassus]|uniref:Uncharacterized protein n=1 Tax=Euplotes crassus TaxID=5936 RepID=A0AAD1UH81_EUPCR|nr:unnamed protein product [Moneuplotes crassus]
MKIFDELDHRCQDIANLHEVIAQKDAEIQTLSKQIRKLAKFRRTSSLVSEETEDGDSASQSDSGSMTQLSRSSSLLNKLNLNTKSRLTLCLNKVRDLMLVKELKEPLQKINTLSFNPGLLALEDAKEFLKNCFPLEVASFHFNKDSLLRNDLEKFLDVLLRTNEYVTDEIVLSNFVIDQDSLVKILSNFKNKEVVSFNSCKMSLSNPPEFGDSLDGATLKHLYLNFCGDKSHGDWASNPAHFENLINGLSHSPDLKASLKDIWMEGSGLKKDKARDILDTFGFHSTKIWILYG